MPALSELEVVRMTDEELVRDLFATVRNVDDAEIMDRLYWLIGEALERWAPDLERRDHMLAQFEEVRDFESSKTEEDAEAEIEAHEKELARRAELRSKFRRIYDPRGDEDA
ncbi:MAG: hypothetical protein ACRDM7_16280 [Thermoleophilaceae bacterium]